MWFPADAGISPKTVEFLTPKKVATIAGVDFELLGSLTDIETIAAGRGIRDLARLRRLYGKGYWRKMKGTARIKLRNGKIRLAEIHWYEAHGIGKKELKRKRYLD